MKKIELSINTIRTLNTMIGNGDNKKAVALLRKTTGCKAFIIKYNKAFAGKYAPRGYGDTAVVWGNSTKEEEKVFSYFLSNLNYAEVFCW